MTPKPYPCPPGCEQAFAAVEAQAAIDAALYLQARREDTELLTADDFAARAFDAIIAARGEDAFAPLTTDQALAVYLYRFCTSLEQAPP